MGLSVTLQWVVERGLLRVGVRGTCVGGEWGEGGKEEGGSEAAALPWRRGEYGRRRLSAFVPHAPYVVAV